MDRGIYAILLGLMVVVPYVLACSKFHLGARAKDTGHNYDTDERKVFYSNIVVYGEVMGKLDKADKKNFLYKDVDGVDTVEFKILCVYKGGSDLARTIYISGIGNENEEIPGCPSAPLKQSDEVVMFLTQTKHPKVFDIEFGPNSGEADLILDDLSMICGLKNDTKGDELCTYFPPLSKAEGCVSWDPIYVTPKPDENPEPEEESPEPEEEEGKEEPEPKEEPSNKDDTVVDIDTEGNENEEIAGCPSAPLQQSDEVVMFLTQTKHPKVFVIEFGPNSGEADLILDDLSMICGLENDTKGDEICTYFPPLSKAKGCVSWDSIYVTPKPDEKPEPEEESPEPEEKEGKEEPEPKEEPSNKDDTVVDIDTEGKGKNNQSDQGYETKTEKGKNTAPAAGSTGDNGSGTTIITASLLVTLATMFLTIVF